MSLIFTGINHIPGHEGKRFLCLMENFVTLVLSCRNGLKEQRDIPLGFFLLQNVLPQSS